MFGCALVAACSSSGPSASSTGSGGATATGGATAVGSGANGGLAQGGTSSTANGGAPAGGSGANGGASTMGASGGAPANGGANGNGGTVAGSTGGATGTRPDGGALGTGCGAGDPKLPSEPSLPAACTTLTANKASANDALAPADETSADTSSIQAALDACPSGQAVRLTTSGNNDAFLSGPLSLDGKTLWVDTGVTLFASRNPRDYDTSAGACGVAGTSNGCEPFIAATGKGAGIVGDGVIDGRGGEPMLGGTKTWWDVSNSTTGSYSNPRLVQVTNAQDFTLYRITLHDSPNFHVVIGSQGFVVWGVTVVTPWKTVNSAGTALTPVYARNTDGIDPAGASNGYVVCSKISDGDDQIAIKGGTATSHLVVAHDRFGAGHGMSIGSETNGGVSDIDVYDLSIDGTFSGMGGGSSNGIRIKSDASRGGLVSNVTYEDVCTRGLANPIILSPHYSTATGSLIPDFQGITIRDFHATGTVRPTVTIDGYDAARATDLTLDNVVVDGIDSGTVTASYANVTLGPGDVNFTPSGSNVTVNRQIAGTSTPNPCTDKWTTF